MLKPVQRSGTTPAHLEKLSESLQGPDGRWLRHALRDGHLWRLTLLLESRGMGMQAPPAARQDTEELDLMDYFGGRAAE
ncbi:hypothetical protein GT347_09875 [Xylophilus rhododendri]|uniref:Uncharacterized protein n=1 Tax=Xylophilus rhododendri TaxID=2697032 RepID=A0A857J608_9BURK|nr:hypothetical protein [Xylophilus rhododendri]QHI98275.1 hypothetical protein GT347_09875 [Xylophilus rhododendri]